jgi:hypothetical protein
MWILRETFDWTGRENALLDGEFAIAELALRCRARTFNERNGTAILVDAKKIPLRNQRFFTDIAENPRKVYNLA